MSVRRTSQKIAVRSHLTKKKASLNAFPSLRFGIGLLDLGMRIFICDFIRSENSGSSQPALRQVARP